MPAKPKNTICLWFDTEDRDATNKEEKQPSERIQA